MGGMGAVEGGLRGRRYTYAAAAAAKSVQSCPTLCGPIDGSPPASLVPGILQARTLEWVLLSFSNAWKWKVKVKSLSLLTNNALSVRTENWGLLWVPRNWIEILVCYIRRDHIITSSYWKPQLARCTLVKLHPTLWRDCSGNSVFESEC